MRCPALLLVLVLMGSTARTSFAATIPRPDHVVVVVEENHDYEEIIGSTSAPYINALAQQSALLTESFALTHPSQPNYLMLFSGTNQGVTDNSCPHTFGAPNLGSELLEAGLSFIGYAEDLPAPGSTICDAPSYARRHVPWVNFTNIPSELSQPFSAFPADFNQLPAISFVTPNLINDMHDGSIEQGDDWLHTHIEPYRQWALTNNSLLIVTWDEGTGGGSNHVATIFAGPMVKTGEYVGRVDHYNLLRTLEDMFNLPHAGNSADAAPIDNIWAENNPGGPIKGAYAGLFIGQEQPSVTNSGYVLLNVTSAGVFAGRMVMGRTTYPLRGRFDAEGAAQVTVRRRGDSPLTVQLNVDLTGTGQMQGTVSSATWTAELQTERRVGTRDASPWERGRYTALLPPPSAAEGGTPGGYGFGTALVSASGAVTISLTLGDGSHAVQVTRISEHGSVPLYLPLYQGRGAVFGWLLPRDSDVVTTNGFTGSLIWSKLPRPRDRFYPEGFVVQSDLDAARYIPPPLAWQDGTAALLGGNLPVDESVAVTASGPYGLISSDRNVILRIARATGLVNGSFVHPETHRRVPLRGVVHQGLQIIAGQFAGRTAVGELSVQPTPPPGL